MSADRQYYPRNGWEGADFQERWCLRCVKEPTCLVLTESYMGPVLQWVYGEDGEATCRAFEGSEHA